MSDRACDLAAGDRRAAEDELRDLRERVVRVGAQLGVRLAGAGTHPFSLSESQPLTVCDRYRELAAALRYPLRREACFGMHVHVAVGNPDKAVRVIEAMSGISRSCSPFRRRARSGVASRRASTRRGRSSSSRFPAAACRRRSAATRTTRAAWSGSWRQGHFPTIPTSGGTSGRIRVRHHRGPDPRRAAVSADSVALAGVVQALVRHYGRRYDEASASRTPIASSSARTAGWPHVTGCTHRWSMPARTQRAARRMVEELLDRMADDAAALGAAEALDRVAAIVARRERAPTGSWP